MDYVFDRMRWMPSLLKADFYISFVRWYEIKGVKDLKQAMQKAADEVGVSLQDAHELLKECNGHITPAMGAIGNREIALYYLQNGERLARESAKVVEAVETVG